MNFTSQGRAGSIVELRAGEVISDEQRSEALARARAGELDRLELVVLAYRQPDEPNGNFVRFAPAILSAIASSFVGKPVLRDHKQRELEARGGTILDSTLVKHEGAPAFRQVLELVKPWAIEAALDGTMDRFSIGWRHEGDVLCSACDLPLFSLKCNHYPGDEVATPRGPRFVEAVFTGGEGLEVSAVNIPAVQGTRVESIQLALSAAREELGRPRGPSAQLCAALALQAGAGEAEALAAVTALQVELAAVRERETAAAAVRLAAETEAIIEGGLSTGRLLPNSDLARHVRATAAVSIEAARAIVAGIPANLFSPVGRPQQSAGIDPTPREGIVLSEDQQRVNRLIGLSDVAFARHANSNSTKDGGR